MCKLPINYQKRVIYRIVCNGVAITETYVGHTTDLKRRRSEHKAICNSPAHKVHNAKRYVFIRDHGGFEAWSVVLVEAYPCTNVEEARQRERFWYEHYTASLNSAIPILTVEERLTYEERRYRDNKPEIRERRNRQYYENHEAERERKREYREAHREELNAKARAKWPEICDAKNAKRRVVKNPGFS